MRKISVILSLRISILISLPAMIGYLYHYDHPPVEEMADEMISILSDRNRIMQKKSLKKLMPGGTIFYSTAFNDEEEEE
ncbi:MAG: hypothetical protein ACLR7D_03620 [Lachnospira eligens]